MDDEGERKGGVRKRWDGWMSGGNWREDFVEDGGRHQLIRMRGGRMDGEGSMEWAKPKYGQGNE